MDAEIYSNLVRLMPKQLIVDVGDSFVKIAGITGSEPSGLGFQMTTAMMQSEKAAVSLVSWCREQFPTQLQFNSPAGQQFMDLDRHGQDVFNQFRQYKLYIQDVLPYECEEVLQTGSLLLSRIDDFHRFRQLSALYDSSIRS